MQTYCDALDTYNTHFGFATSLLSIAEFTIHDYDWFVNVENCGFDRINRTGNPISSPADAYANTYDIESVYWHMNCKLGKELPIIVMIGSRLIMLDGVHRTVAASIIGRPIVVNIMTLA